MNQRIDMLEHDMAEVKADLQVIRANYARREDVQGVLARVAAMEQRFDATLPHLATKVEVQALAARIAAVEQRLDDELPHLATKADLQALRSEMRTWMVTTAISLFFATATLQFSFYQLMQDSIKAEVQTAVRQALSAPRG